jgi:hypothetical protein
MLAIDQNFVFFKMVLMSFAAILNIKILCTYRKMDKTIHRNFVCIQHAFAAYRAQLTGTTNAPFERAFVQNFF